MPNLTISSSHSDTRHLYYPFHTRYQVIYLLRRAVISRLHPLMGMRRIRWNVIFGICSKRKNGWNFEASHLGGLWLMTDNPPVPSKISVSKTAGIPTLYTLQVEDGMVFAMYSGSQVQNLKPVVCLFLTAIDIG